MRFEIGEIAIFRPTYTTKGKCGDGSECEIVSGPLNDIFGAYYICHFQGDPGPTPCGNWRVHGRSLRKRKPPREELGDWESLESNIGWKRPMEVA